MFSESSWPEYFWEGQMRDSTSIRKFKATLHVLGIFSGEAGLINHSVMCSSEQQKAQRAGMKARVGILIWFRFVSNVLPLLLGNSWSRSAWTGWMLSTFLGLLRRDEREALEVLEIQCNRSSQVYQVLSGSTSSLDCPFWVSAVSFSSGVFLPSPPPWITAVAFYLALFPWLYPLSPAVASLKRETHSTIPAHWLSAYEGPYTAYSI